MATGTAIAVPLAEAEALTGGNPAGLDDEFDVVGAGSVGAAGDGLAVAGGVEAEYDVVGAGSVGAAGDERAELDDGPVEPVDEAGWQDGAAVPSRCNHASAAVEAS